MKPYEFGNNINKFSTREYNKKSGHDSFLDLSKSFLNDSVLSNTVIINAITNFLDTKTEDKSKHKNPKGLYHSQIKLSSKNTKILKLNKSSKSLIKNNNKSKNSSFNVSHLSKSNSKSSMINNTNHNNTNHNNTNHNNTNHNNTNHNNTNHNNTNYNNNLLSVEYSPSKKSNNKAKNRPEKKSSLDIRSSNEVIKRLSNNTGNNKFEIGKISNPKRAGTINGMKNKKLKETIIGRKKTVDVFPMKKKKPFKLLGDKLLNNNSKRRSCFNNFGHISNNKKN